MDRKDKQRLEVAIADEAYHRKLMEYNQERIKELRKRK